MEAVLVHGSQTMIDYTPGADVAAGEVVSFGENVAIANRAIASGVLGALAAPSGNAVYDITKEAGGGVTFALGALVYWDATGNTATADNTDKGAGICVKAAVDGDSSVRILHAAVKVTDTTGA